MSRFVAALMLSCLSAAWAQQDQYPGIATPGYHQLTLPQAGRRYTLVIPEGYSGEEPVPLVVSLHYGGGVTPFYGRGLLQSLVEPALRELGAIFVAPDSAAGDWTNPLAEQHVLELVDYIEGQYNIDLDRTLLTGYSMGGRGTWYLAARYPDRFRAAVAIAGQPQPDSATMEWRTPLYVIHSAADQVISLGPTREVVEQLRARGVSVELAVVDNIGHSEVPRYRSLLVEAVPWIRQAWGE